LNIINKDNKNEDKQETIAALLGCIPVLEKIANQFDLLEHLPEHQRTALITAAGKISRPDPEEIKKRKKNKKDQKHRAVVEKERRLRAATGIRKAREAPVFTAPRQISYSEIKDCHEDSRQGLESPRNCYICKKEFTKLHHFYDSMCMECAEFNYQKRFQTASLKGQVALITGSRLKIGYQSTLMMLRAGAEVIASTRFPKDSALRFSCEPDFSEWGSRLHIYGLDLRHIPSVELFCDYIKDKYQRLDILINNAAQTVRRPPGFYAHLMKNETKHAAQLPQNAQTLLGHYQTCISQLEYGHTGKGTENLPVTWNAAAPGIGMSAQLSQIPYSYDHSLDVPKVFPADKLDADLQQVDLRKTNSWRLKLGEIETSEMLEVQLVNSIAPFVLCNRLAELMKLDFTGKKHIVNVSAMEGKFLRFKKDSRHPHTNMAKASLNMLTHTAAEELAKHGIYINAVDTGWVTDEDPAVLAKHKQERHDFQPPLDIVDGAARVCDPFFHGILTGKHWSGKFLKDYFPIDW